MTKEEAKLVLDNARPQTKEIDRQFYDDEDLNNALDMAIKSLEQQSSDDCVSRQAVNEYLEKLLDGRFDDFMSAAIIGIKDNINAMPPTTPTHGTCKDCKHCKKDFSFTDKPMCLSHGLITVNDDFYCKDFERRENDGN